MTKVKVLLSFDSWYGTIAFMLFIASFFFIPWYLSVFVVLPVLGLLIALIDRSFKIERKPKNV